MVEQKKQTFLHGAFILVIGSIFVKILGAGFKIPLTMLIKTDGMGLFNTSYTLYAFFVLAAKGLSVAVSKMVSESSSLGRRKEADRIFYVAFVLLGIIGIAGTSLLYFGAEAFSAMLGNTRAAVCIEAIAPAVLFVALVSALRGYFQGRQNMYPTAISEVVEAFGKLVFGILLAWWFIGTSTQYAAAGAVFGVTLGTFVTLLLVLAFFIIGKKKRSINAAEKIRSVMGIAKELVLISLPITIGASVASLTGVVDMMTIMNRLQSIKNVTPEFIAKYHVLIEGHSMSKGIYEELANKLYGLYSGYAVTLFNLPLTMIVALSISVLPAISGALKRNDEASAQKTMQSVLRITMLFSMPCAFGLSVLAAPVLSFIFNDTLAARLLEITSIAIIFVSLVQVTNAILQAYGKMHIPVVNMIIGCIVKIALNYYLVGLPNINVDGAPISTLACYLVIALLNFVYLIKLTRLRISISEFIIKPLSASVGMAVLSVFVINVLNMNGIGGRLAVIPAILVGGIAYLLLIFLVGAVKESDVAMLPMGDKLTKTFKKLHILR